MKRLLTHYHSILRLGIPIIVGQVAIILLGFIDNMMVGQHNIKELSASSFVNNFQNIMLIFGIGFSYGLTPLVAEADKKGKHSLAGQLLHSSLLLNFAVASVIGLIVIAFVPFLSYFNLSDELRPIALPYYYLQTIAFLVSMLFNAFKQFFDGMSRTKLPAYITVGGIGLNIFLNYLLIYGKWGFPEWGLFGAGLATLISRIVMLLVIITAFYKEKMWRTIHSSFAQLRWQKEIARSLIRLGTPISIQLGLEATSFSIIIIFVAKLGAFSLAGHQVVMVVTLLGYLIYYGLGAATAIRVSHFKALRNYSEIRKVTQAAVHIGLFLATSSALLMWLSRNSITLLFTDEKEVIKLVAIALAPVVLYQFADVLQVIFSNALRGLSTVKRLIPIAFVSHILVAPSLSYVFCFIVAKGQPDYQLMAIWSSFPISLSLAAFLLYRYLGSSLKKEEEKLSLERRNYPQSTQQD